MNPSNNLHQVLSTLDGIDPDKCRGLMSNYDSFINRIQHKISIQTFIAHYRSAEKNYLKGYKDGEKKSLIRARNIIDSEKIKDQDLSDEDLRDYITGTLLTAEKIAKRLGDELRRDL